MAQRQYTGDINKDTDWGGDQSTGNLPVSGGSIQRFIKSQLGSKYGYVTFENGELVFYESEGGEVLMTLPLSGSVYAITITANVASSFHVLTSDTTKMMQISASTKSGTIGGEMEDYPEDYTYVVAVDNGSGSFVEKATGNIANGGYASFNIRNWLSVGANRIRVNVRGTSSGQVKSTIYSCTLTTLTLSCDFSWERAWMEDDEAYAIDNIRFAGNLQKTLYVRIDKDDSKVYSETFSSGTNYSSTSYSYPLGDKFPTTTGLHTIELWMEGGGVSTRVYEYSVMCVATGDEDVSMVCINNIADAAMNYMSGRLFDYATYNATSVAFSITVDDGEEEYEVVSGETIAVQTQTRNGYIRSLEIETEVSSGIELDAIASVTGNYQEITMPVDNSNAALAVDGAWFYMNAASRQNGTGDETTIINQARNAAVEEYQGTFTGFSWNKDGWSTDKDGNKALVVQAGSKVTIPVNMLSGAATGSVSIEMKVRCSAVADYDTPVLTIMDTQTYDGETTNGIVLFPTKLVALNSGGRSTVLQGVNLCENMVTHICIVIQRAYGGNSARNLVTIYVNGNPNVSFSYEGTASWGNGTLSFGQDDSDFYMYMLRAYNKALESSDVLANFVNAIIEGAEFSRETVKADNDIIDGTDISYDMAKRAGYNCMVVEMDDTLPDINHTDSSGKTCTLRLEYADHPDWNVSIANAPIDGQGTTSMKYYRWNLRFKLNGNCVWTYADGTSETTKSGYIDGHVHGKTERITAKKNYASSMQGHKMGACAAYDDLFTQVGLKLELPSPYRVAVYQYPVLGFQKFSDGSYSFIGLYTVGPDKGCKKTFGYDEELYPDCMSLEGPNHNPLGTRFLHPWVDVDYSTSDETLKFGGEEGWDADYISGVSTDDADDHDAILAKYVSEWKPAYEIVYFCSPWIASLSEVGKTISQINADVVAFRNGNTNGVSNALLQLYDANYNLYYYRTSTGQYEQLSGHDMLTYLGLSGSPTTAQIIAARGAKFKTDMGSYWSVRQTLFHYCFCVLFGCTDNFAKNSYPYKFTSLQSGGRWGWREDDMDTILATDNNGQSTKDYGIEATDKTLEGVEIFQGGNSALWVLIGNNYESEIKAMMESIVSAAVTIAGRLGISGNHTHETLYNFVSYYFWEQSAKYFPIACYTEDRKWSYIEPWLVDAGRTYNNVYPLTQALGDQYQAEKLWVERRIAYIFSKYRIGAFTGSAEGYNLMSFTPAANFTFNIKPAIDLYPVASLGGGTDIQGARTKAGNIRQLTVSSDGQTTVYLKGMDWLTELGDLSGLRLTSRGGETDLNLAVIAARLQTLKVGDAVAANVDFNANILTVASETLTSIDARNTTSINQSVNLFNCPRLRTALFAGSTAPGLLLPEGSKVEEVSFPATINTLFLHTLAVLDSEGMTISDATLAGLTGLYVNRCVNITGIDILFRILSLQSHSLAYITILWSGVVNITGAELDKLVALAADVENYGRVVYSGGSLSNSSEAPVIEGTVHLALANQDDIDAVRAAFPNLTITADVIKNYIKFQDPVVGEICATNWGDYTEVVTTEVVSDGSNEVAVTTVTTPVSMMNTTATRGDSTTVQSTRAKEAGETAGTTTTKTKIAVGITYEQAAAVSSLGTKFRNNTEITRFNELNYFSRITSLSVEFGYCSNLSELNLINITALPANSVFSGAKIRNIFLPKFAGSDKWALRGCVAKLIDLGENISFLGNKFYYDSVSDVTFIVRSLTPPSFTGDLGYTGQKPNAIFVPSASLQLYKETSSWSSYASVIFAIGGTEWQTMFGSSNEYADILQKVPQYYDEYVAAYESA